MNQISQLQQSKDIIKGYVQNADQMMSTDFPDAGIPMIVNKICLMYYYCYFVPPQIAWSAVEKMDKKDIQYECKSNLLPTNDGSNKYEYQIYWYGKIRNITSIYTNFVKHVEKGGDENFDMINYPKLIKVILDPNINNGKSKEMYRSICPACYVPFEQYFKILQNRAKFTLKHPKRSTCPLKGKSLDPCDTIIINYPDWFTISTGKAKENEIERVRNYKKIRVEIIIHDLSHSTSTKIYDDFIGSFKYIKQIEPGASAIVHAVFDIKNNNVVAIKDVQDETYIREAEILQTLHHKNIVQFIKLYAFNHKSNEFAFIVLELCDSDLRSVQFECWQNGEILAKRMFTDIIPAIQRLEEFNVIHLDLKPGNYKITDFGTWIYKGSGDGELLGTMAGTGTIWNVVGKMIDPKINQRATTKTIMASKLYTTFMQEKNDGFLTFQYEIPSIENVELQENDLSLYPELNN